MDNGGKKVVMAQMRPRERREWTKEKTRKRGVEWGKRRVGKTVAFSGAFFFPWNAAGATTFFWGGVQAVLWRVNKGVW